MPPPRSAEPNHCAHCGGPLTLLPLGPRARRGCARCGFVHYQNPASAAAGVVLDERGAVLLVRRAIEPFRGCWALPAGYQEIDESPEETVLREVREETGVEARVLGLLDLFFIPDDPRKPANVGVFLCEAIGGAPRGSDDALEAGFFGLDALPQPIGFDNYERILGRLTDPDRYPLSAWEWLRRRLARDA